MAGLADSVILAQGINYSGSGDWLDETGNSLDITITGPTFASNVFTFDGFNDEMSVADSALLDFGATDPFTVLVMGKKPDVTPLGNQCIIAKKANFTGGGPGYLLYNRPAGNVAFGIDDGTLVWTVTPALSDDTRFVVAGVRNVSDDDIEGFLDGTGSGSPAADTTTGTLANASPLVLGRDLGPNIDPYLGEIHAFAVIPLALSDAEVATASTQLESGFSFPSTSMTLIGA